MKFRRKTIAVAVSLCVGINAYAQDTAQIVVTGIRASIEKSIDTKKNADANVEVVTAEDVGKMPDKNIADALSRLPGVNVSSVVRLPWTRRNVSHCAAPAPTSIWSPSTVTRCHLATGTWAIRAAAAEVSASV